MVMLITHIAVGENMGKPGVGNVVPFVPPQRPLGEGGPTLDERRGLVPIITTPNGPL